MSPRSRQKQPHRNHADTHARRDRLRAKLLAAVTARGAVGITPEDLRHEVAVHGSADQVRAEMARLRTAGLCVRDNRNGVDFRWYVVARDAEVAA